LPTNIVIDKVNVDTFALDLRSTILGEIYCGPTGGGCTPGMTTFYIYYLNITTDTGGTLNGTYEFATEGDEMWQLQQRDIQNTIQYPEYVYSGCANPTKCLPRTLEELISRDLDIILFPNNSYLDFTDPDNIKPKSTSLNDLNYHKIILSNTFKSTTFGESDFNLQRKPGINILIKLKNKFFKQYLNDFNPFYDPKSGEGDLLFKPPLPDTEPIAYCGDPLIPSAPDVYPDYEGEELKMPDDTLPYVEFTSNVYWEGDILKLNVDASASFDAFQEPIISRGGYPFVSWNKLYFDWAVYGLNETTQELEIIGYALNALNENLWERNNIIINVPKSLIQEYNKITVLMKGYMLKKTYFVITNVPDVTDPTVLIQDPTTRCWTGELVQPDFNKCGLPDEVDCWLAIISQIGANKADWYWEEIEIPQQTSSSSSSGTPPPELPIQEIDLL
jgi:hypothetical protein